jgi:hypothetical protein
MIYILPAFWKKNVFVVTHVTFSKDGDENLRD